MSRASNSLSSGSAPQDASAQGPWPGSHAMPRWNVNELPEAPQFRWREIWRMLGPGLVMGAAAIGGGEWLAGPAITAKYGASLLWIGTVSILFQVVYNIEISRYTLYTGEPIFSGKLRIFPGPWVWATLYLMLDWGAVLPYLLANAAVPLEALILGRLPDSSLHVYDWWLHKGICSALWLLTLIPLLVGGKVYNSLKIVMATKLILVVGFLLVIGIFFTTSTTWSEIFTGLFRFGSVPVVRAEDLNGNGVLDAGEDFDRDGRLDEIEPLRHDEQGRVIGFEDRDGDKIRDGINVDNVLTAWWQGRSLPNLDFSTIAVIAGLAAIAGNGGLTNTPISSFTRDQGWGMGHHVGAIPSAVGGKGIVLSHVGSVFLITTDALRRWRGWLRHVQRDQCCVWLVASLLGVALPSILSVEFLQRGTEAKDWSGAAMTAGGVEHYIDHPKEGVLAQRWGWGTSDQTANWGRAFWTMTLLCGFLVLITSHITTMDGFVRRWVDVMWTASARMRDLPDHRIGTIYLTILLGYATASLILVWLPTAPNYIFQLSTTGYNYAFAISAWHTVVINATLLPRELQPRWWIRGLLVLAGFFYTGLGILSTLRLVGFIQ